MNCEDHEGFNCADLKAKNFCEYAKVKQACPDTCGVCEEESEDGEERCFDREEYDGECKNLAAGCSRSIAIAAKCAKTCGMDPSKCGSLADHVHQMVRYAGPPRGLCYPPIIPNGRILNQKIRGKFRSGTVLKVRCARGLTLSGEPMKCEIQNLYGPDSRRGQTCVRVAETFTGSGADYRGDKTTTAAGHECDNWLASAHTGAFRLDLARSVMKNRELGNHNRCRNPAGEDFAPYCYVHGYFKEYCFVMPNCGAGICEAGHRDLTHCQIYSPSECEALDQSYSKRTSWYWQHCEAMCCAHNSCPALPAA